MCKRLTECWIGNWLHLEDKFKRGEIHFFSVQNTSSCSRAQNTRPINQSEQKLDQIPIPGCCCSSSYLQCFARGSPLLQVQLSLLRTSTTPMHSAFTFFLLSFYFSNCFYSCFKILQSCLICYMLLFICLIVFSLCFFLTSIVFSLFLLFNSFS